MTDPLDAAVCDVWEKTGRLPVEIRVQDSPERPARDVAVVTPSAWQESVRGCLRHWWRREPGKEEVLRWARTPSWRYRGIRVRP